MNMFGPLIEEWFSGVSVIRGPSYNLSFREISRKRNPLTGSWTVAVRVLAWLKTPEIRFDEMIEFLLAALQKVSGERIGRVRSSWLVSSPSGGIYLYELFDTPNNRRRGLMRNRFIVLNTCDGTVSFGPGNELNRPFSDRMREFIERAPSLPAVSRARELAPILERAFELA